MTPVNCYLTIAQREWLTNEYLNQLSKLDDSLIDDAYNELIHMPNGEFYTECREFMPTCMTELRDAGIR